MILSDENKLADVINGYQKRGKKVLVKLGVFDLIHAGHTETFKKLKRITDIVVIIIWHDKDVAHLKPGRPIVNQRGRAMVLDAMKNVDVVFMAKNYFDGRVNHFEEEFVPFLERIKPDVVVIRKGSLHEREYYQNPNWQYVEIDEFVKDHSTTRIVNKILNSYHQRKK